VLPTLTEIELCVINRTEEELFHHLKHHKIRKVAGETGKPEDSIQALSKAEMRLTESMGEKK
jgi:hypothetical protein